MSFLSMALEPAKPREFNAVQALSQIDAMDFQLPPELEATAPPETRGIARDQVRLMISYVVNDRVIHARFRDLGSFLDAGDVLVVNTSGTMRAAINATRDDGMPLELHLSTHLSAGNWVVELRTPANPGTKPFFDGRLGETLRLPDGATATLESPYPKERAPEPPIRLWVAALRLPIELNKYLERYGFPIHYGYIKRSWSIDYYQLAYATEVGSAEMPSAGRPFTAELITHLMASGITIVPLLLHTGVASLERGEAPYPEYYRVPAETARAVNTARGLGRRVVAVGTTVVRALETLTDQEGVTRGGEGWTDLVVTPRRGIRAINALVTGFHEPRATHLAMLEALAGRGHLQIAYAEAVRERYLWHEFGDSHLISIR